jgi:hypothetical protein
MASNNEAPDARVLREKGNGLYKNGQLAEGMTIPLPIEAS